MTDRERELETEVRMLREQVASLERIITSQPAIQVGSQQLVPYAVPQTWWWNGATWCSGTVTTSDAISPAT
jgi:hypothetical protein